VSCDFTLEEIITMLRNACINMNFADALGWVEELEEKLKELIEDERRADT